MKNKAIQKIILTSIILFLFGCVAKQFKPVELTQVVEVGNKDQETIYNRTRQWFSQYFVSGKSVIDYEDKKEGTIIGNGVAEIGTGPFGLIKYKIEYNVRIDTKNGKFRALTKIIKHTNTDTKSTYTVANVSEDRAADAAKHVSKIIADIKAYVTGNSDAKSNW